MLCVILPLATLLVIALCKKIPVIGGKIEIALLVSAALALLTSGVYNPIDWLKAIFDGVNRFSWILWMLPAAAIYAQAQIKLGSMDGVVRLLKGFLGNSRRSLIAVTCFSLFIAGSMLGVGSAATAVVGVLVAAALDKDGMPVEITTAIIVMSGALGSLMPPISSSFVQSASIIGANESDVMKIGYVATFAAAIFVLAYTILVFGSKRFGVSTTTAERENPLKVLREIWPKLIPMMVLLGLVILNSGFGIDLITMAIGPVLDFLNGIPIIKGVARTLVISLLIAAAVSFLYKPVRENSKEIFTKAFKSVSGQAIRLICASCLLGAMYAGNQINVIEQVATQLNSYALIFGGGIAMIILGMLTGADSVALSTIMPFYGPAILALGLPPATAAVAISCISTAGQGLPPADMMTFVVCGLLSGLLGKKIDPLKVMIYASPMCLCLAGIGFFLIFTGIA